MTTGFAAAEARLAGALPRLFNATLELSGDESSAVSGHLTNAVRESYVGVGVMTREMEFECPLASIAGWGALGQEGDAVTLRYKDVATLHTIAERLPDDKHLQLAVFLLRSAA